MTTLKNALTRLIRDEEGASLVEYALLVALIGIVAIAGMTVLGNNANSKLNSAATTIGT